MIGTLCDDLIVTALLIVDQNSMLNFDKISYRL